MVEKRSREILAAVADGAVAQQPGGGGEHDLLLRTRDERTFPLRVKWAGEGWPQDVRAAVRDVPTPWPSDVVLVARRLSPGAIDWLRDIGANWADETGQARIFGPNGLIVVRENVTPTPAPRRRKRFSWPASALDIAELVLSREDSLLRATALARISRWSVPQTANVLRSFDGQGWTVKRGGERGPHSYRELAQPDAMLASWSDALGRVPRPARIAHRATRDVMALLQDDLAPALSERVGWAVSGWAGLEFAAPFATTIPSLHIYIAEADFAGALSRTIEAAGLREVEDGGRVTFWPANIETLRLAEQHHEFPVVSPPRLYADLISFGARGLDAAAHVKDELIDPLRKMATSRGGSDG